MSSERIKSEVVFTCDGEDCDETLETGEHGFADANTARRQSGWTAFENDMGAWEHRCPECRGR
jgi:hypothetical protein